MLLDAKHRGGLVATVLSGCWRVNSPTDSISAGDFKLVAPALLNSPVAGLVWHKFRHNWPAQDLANQFQDLYRTSILRAEIQAINVRDVINRVRSVGLEPILHKGWASARTYAEPGLRSYADIDLMIPPGCEERALSALRLEPPISCPVDLIHSEITELDTVTWDALFRRSRMIKLGEMDIRVLSAEDHLRSLCIHCLKHGNANPSWLIDVASALETRPDNFDWEHCIGSSEPQADWVRCALGLAHRLLKAEAYDTSIALPGWLVRSVLRRWSHPDWYYHGPRLASILRGDGSVVEAAVRRWPLASYACVNSHVRLTGAPVLHLQLKRLFATERVRTFLTELPRVLRALREP